MERTGVEVLEEFSHSFLIRDGKVVEWRMYDSHEYALEAVRLRSRRRVTLTQPSCAPLPRAAVLLILPDRDERLTASTARSFR